MAFAASIQQQCRHTGRTMDLDLNCVALHAKQRYGYRWTASPVALCDASYQHCALCKQYSASCLQHTRHDLGYAHTLLCIVQSVFSKLPSAGQTSSSTCAHLVVDEEQDRSHLVAQHGGHVLHDTCLAGLQRRLMQKHGWTGKSLCELPASCKEYVNSRNGQACWLEMNQSLRNSVHHVLVQLGTARPHGSQACTAWH